MRAPGNVALELAEQRARDRLAAQRDLLAGRAPGRRRPRSSASTNRQNVGVALAWVTPCSRIARQPLARPARRGRDERGAGGEDVQQDLQTRRTGGGRRRAATVLRLGLDPARCRAAAGSSRGGRRGGAPVVPVVSTRCGRGASARAVRRTPPPRPEVHSSGRTTADAVEVVAGGDHDVVVEALQQPRRPRRARPAGTGTPRRRPRTRRRAARRPARPRARRRAKRVTPSRCDGAGGVLRGVDELAVADRPLVGEDRRALGILVCDATEQLDQAWTGTSP